MRTGLTLTILLSTVSIYGAGPMIVAHRGASKDAPENTLPAFELAFKQNADAIEGDFLLTKDGHIVCIHDRDTKKVAGKKLSVRESTLEQLRALDVGIRKGEKFKNTRIPTIAEVFATIPKGKVIYVEIKCGTEIIPPLLEEIKKSGLRKEQIVVICFNAGVLKELKVKAPELKVSWLCSFRKDRKSGKVSPSLEKVLGTLKTIRADGLSSNTGISKEFVDQVRAKGYQWHVWTVNDEKTAGKMKTMGAASITTDLPEKMRGYLK